MDLNKQIEETASALAQFPFIDPVDIPKIDLYMEQILSFMDQQMEDAFLKEEPHVFTKTMVNNYTKEGILPRPNNKKYNRQHMVTLLYVYLLKQTLSMPDIRTFSSITPDEDTLETQYDLLLSLSSDYQSSFMEKLHAIREHTESVLEAQGLEDDDAKLMAFISLLSFESALNKRFCELLLKEWKEEQTEKERIKREKQEQKQEQQEQEKKEIKTVSRNQKPAKGRA